MIVSEKSIAERKTFTDRFYTSFQNKLYFYRDQILQIITDLKFIWF